MSTYILLSFIFLAAGFTQGVSGFGAALIAMPLLTLILDVKEAAPLCMMNGLLITSYLSFQLRNHIDWKKIKPLFLGCLPGILIGVFLLKKLDGNILNIFLGVLLILYSVHRLKWQPQISNIHSLWSYVTGFASGVIGGAFSAGGPPVVILVSLTKWKKDVIKATLSIFFFTTGVLTSATHAAHGLINSQLASYFACTALFTVLGVFLGSKCYDRIEQETYIKIMLLLLILFGCMMILSTLV